MSNRITTLAILLLLAFPAGAFSGETVTAKPIEDGPSGTSSSSETASPAFAESSSWSMMPDRWWEVADFIPPQHFTLRPSYLIYAGYRFVGVKDTGRRAAQYEYLHDSFAGGLRFSEAPLPWRVAGEFDYKNRYDRSAALTLDYRDILSLDYRNMALYRNLDHLQLIAPGAIDSSPKQNYWVAVDENEVKLSLTNPYTMHRVYANYREWKKTGTIQQRWDPGTFTDVTQSDTRNIDWVTRELTAGVSVNLFKFVELDYHHTFKTFDSRRQSVLLDTYTDPAGLVLQHNLTPDFTSNYDTLSLHTPQDKAVSASGTFTLGNKKNEFSGSRVYFHREAGDVSARPLDNLIIAVKYGHQRLHAVSPDVVNQVDYSTPVPTVTPLAVTNPPISQTRDRGTAALMYYPVPNLGLLAEYRLDAVERTNADAWTDIDTLLVSEKSSTTHTGKVGVTYTPERHTKVRASFSYSRNNNPSYHTEYMNAYKGFVWGSWVPKPGLTVNAQYKILSGNNPVFRPDGSLSLLGEMDRRVRKDEAGAGVTWFAVQGLVVGAHYDYLRFNARSNLIYNNALGFQVFTFNTPYWDTSHAYSVFANYCFSFPLSVETSFGQTWSRGMYRLGTAFLDINGAPAILSPDPTLLDTLTDQKIRETHATCKASYEFYKGWGTTLCYAYSQFTDMAHVASPVTGERDGRAHIGTALLTKKW